MLTLTKDEIIEITGARQRDSQREALLQMQIPFKLRPDGWPVVLRAVVELEFGYATKEKGQTPPKLRVPQARRVLLRKQGQMDATGK